MLVLLVIVDRSGSQKDSGVGEQLYPTLKDRLGEVDYLRLASSEEEVVIAMENGGWKVLTREGYPANFSSLFEFLNGLAQVKYQERKTSKAENHARLGLADASSKEGQALAVTASMDEVPLVDMLLGNASAHMDGRYFRHPDQNQVWLLDEALDVSTDVTQWLDPIIVDVPEEDVERVQQTAAGEIAFVAIRDEAADGNFIIANAPENQHLRYPTVANELGRALVNLRLKDVRKEDSLDWSVANKTEFTSSRNMQLLVWSLAQGDAYFLKIDVQSLAADSSGGSESTDSDVKELSERLQPWIFEITQTTYQQFDKTVSDFLVENSSDAKDS